MVGILSGSVNMEGKCLPGFQAWSFAFLTPNFFGSPKDLESDSQIIFPCPNPWELKSNLEPARY